MKSPNNPRVVAPLNAERLRQSAGTYAQQIVKHGANEGVRLRAIVILQVDGLGAHWASNLDKKSVRQVLETLSREAGLEAMVIAPTAH